jgi:hypothetical protein
MTTREKTCRQKKGPVTGAFRVGGRGNLKIGNTEVLATMIRKHIVANVYPIRAANRYPHDYEATVDRNVREQNADARPRIANPLKCAA